MNRTNFVAVCSAHPASDFAGSIHYYLKHFKKNVNKRDAPPYNSANVHERLNSVG